MGDGTGIEWTDATPVWDRAGQRLRFYHRKRTDRPGTQERRRQRAQGRAWCHSCRAWLPAANVTPQGLCRPHANEDYRRRYAAGGKVAIAARVHARKRNVAPVPPILAAALMEQFDGRCAYCPAPATTWDHLVAVKLGGKTVLGNVVPACVSCNARKGIRPPESMPGVSALVVDVLSLAEVF